MPGFCVSRGLHGLLSCCELLNRQRVSQPASCQASTSSLLLFVLECSRAESLPPSVFPFPTESSNLLLLQELCLTAAYHSWNEKPVTKASVSFTAIVPLKQGEGAKSSAKHGTAGFNGGPEVAAAAGLQ